MSSISGVTKREALTEENSKDSLEFNIKSHYIDILRGRDGRDGLPGSQGPAGPQGTTGEQGPRGIQGPPGGGTVYTRWGRTVCPNTTGTELVYKGLAAGSRYNQHGGGANYLCTSEQPQYLDNTNPTFPSQLYGAEYDWPVVNSINAHNVPCAVCYTSQRSTKLMIPGTITCPLSWTEEYEGYLMAGHHNKNLNYVYECVDKDGEAVPGPASNANGALFFHVTAVGDFGLPRSYLTDRAVTCVVCTK